jgi:hypothetical protein
MKWLEQNLDAYRIVAEILNDLRSMLRRELERIHGPQWYRTGVPETVLERLIASKEQERSIDWYESEYQQVIDYAVFPDLLEILEQNAEHFPTIMKLAPSGPLLHARFLELEVMRSKLGRTRPVSESELSFLSTFHLRFRKAIEAIDSQEVATNATAPPAPEAQDPVADEARSEPAAQEIEIDEPEPEPAVEPDTTPPDPEPPAESPAERPSRPPTRGASTPSGSADSGEPAPDLEADDEDEPVIEEEAAGKVTLASALADGDTKIVLRELYREVTGIADGIWSSDVIPAPIVWDEVCTSDWYEKNFSSLGLKPLSDFYEIISKVESTMAEGGDRKQVQAYLKQTNFAQVLLALRDMFQKNGL